MSRFGTSKRSKRSRKTNLTTIQEFEVEDMAPIEMPRAQTEVNMLASSELSILPLQTSSPRVNLPTLNNDLSRSGRSCSADSPLVESSEGSYLSIKLAADMIPRFDGKSCSIFKFIRQCQSVNSQIKPSDRTALLMVVRNKIIGQADFLISNREEPKSIDELIDLLKIVYDSAFDVNHIHGELRSLKQNLHEPIALYAARAREILSRGLQAAKEKFNSEQLKGAIALLNQAAIANFKQGFRNPSFRLHLPSEKIDDFEEIASVACRLGREIGEEQQFLSPQPVHDAKVFVTNTRRSECFNCNKEGHFRRNCPLQRDDNFNSSPRDRGIRCRYCKKSGHHESRCFKKQNEDCSSGKQGAITPGFHHLNSRVVSRKGVSRNEPLIARSQSNAPVSNSM